MAINDDAALEREADVMGVKALQMTRSDHVAKDATSLRRRVSAATPYSVKEASKSLSIESNSDFPTASHGMTEQFPTAVTQLKNGKDKLVYTGGEKFKKKKKERREQAEADASIAASVERWVIEYGHAEERHVGLNTVQLDARLNRISVATTFETADDLLVAATRMIEINESKINSWYENTEDENLNLWIYMPDGVNVRGRERGTRPDWHYKQQNMPPRPAHADVNPDELLYVNAFFRRDHWSQAVKGLITCFPSKTAV